MAYLPFLPGDAVLLDVFRAYPDTDRPLLYYHQALLRGPSPLTVAEREMIAAYVSGLNACQYCHGVHQATARAFGVGDGTLAALVADVGTTEVPEPMKPILRYVGKLTLSPAKITPEDAEAVLAAGWKEQAKTRMWSLCPWKALARYYTAAAGGQQNKNAAWYYPHPSPLARKIKNHVAFWNGVEVEPVAQPQGQTNEAG